jgi:ribosomal protein S18 acetylase RimI-like enzyme
VTPDKLQDLSYDALAFAVEKNAVEEFRVWSRWPGLEFRVENDRIYTITSVRSPIFNTIVRATFDPEGADESIDRTLLPFRERNVPAYWWVGRSSRPGDLGSRLTAHGLTTAFIAPAMAADLQRLPENISAPAGLVVEEVTHTRAFDQWLKFSSASMDLPPSAIGPWTEVQSAIGFGPSGPLRHFLALLGGEPAAAASLFTGSGIAGMANLVTKKEYRRKGIGSSLTVTLLKAARSSGFRVGALYSTAEAAGMYRRLGFREYGREWCYLWDGGRDN